MTEIRKLIEQSKVTITPTTKEGYEGEDIEVYQFTEPQLNELLKRQSKNTWDIVEHFHELRLIPPEFENYWPLITPLISETIEDINRFEEYRSKFGDIKEI